MNNNDIDKIQKENEVLTNHTVNSMSKSSSKKRPSYLQPTKSSQSKLKMNQSNNESNIANKSMNSTSNNYYSKSNNSSTSNIKRNYRPYTTNQVTLNYGERLYHKEQKLQEKKQQKISQLRSKIEEENKKNNTFRPKINRISYNALSKRYSNKLSYNDEDNIVYYKDYREQKLSELKQKIAKDEEYSFTPTLNKRSLTMEKYRQKPSTPRYEQLYHNYKKQKLNIEDLANQIYDKKTLFKPKVNNYQCPYTNITFEERQNYYLSKSQEKARALREQIESPSDALTGQRFFHPEINEYERPENFDIFENLYNESLKYTMKKQELVDLYTRQEKSISSASHVNMESVELFEGKKERAFKKIFQQLDKDKDDLITKVNIEVKALPPKIQEILSPIVTELKEEDETLNENEFVTACYQLYEILSYPDKLELLNYGKPDSQRQTNMNFTFKPKINNYSSNIVSRASSGYGQSNSRRNISNANSRRVMNQLIHRDSIDLKRILIIVVIALVPCALFGMWNVGHEHNLVMGTDWGFWRQFGFGFLKVLPLYLVSYIVGLAIEFMFAQIRGEEVSEGYLVSGMLIPLIVPVDVPLWMLAIAVAFAVIFGKEVFGGTGMNFLNPALLARAFLFFSYPSKMSGSMCWIALRHGEALPDAVSGATPLSFLGECKDAVTPLTDHFSYMDMFLGTIPGSVGETSVIAILLGAVILLWTGIGSWKIMLSSVIGALFAIGGFFE